MAPAIPKYSPTPAACLEVWGWRTGVGRIPQAVMSHRHGEEDEGIDQGLIISNWTERFMGNQLYRPIVLAYICQSRYSWREPCEPEITALIRHGIAFMLDQVPPEWIPTKVHAHALKELTDWSLGNPPPTFSKSFEQE